MMTFATTMCEKPDFVDLDLEKDLETPAKNTRALTHGYKSFYLKNLFGGESGLRTTASCGKQRT